MNLKNRNITVLGLGRSGFESAKFLCERGARVFVSEFKSTEHFLNCKNELELLEAEVELGKHSFDRISRSDFIVISPGISPTTEIYQKTKSRSIPLVSEIELAYRFCPAPIVAVTGTNGKTTVTTLVHKMLLENGFQSVICGNIGNPFIGEVSRLNKDSVVVLEISSFQLQNISKFRPHIAILLNLTDNHYDWHGDFNNYADAKWNVFKNQTANDYALLNENDHESVCRAHSVRAQKVYFGAGEFNNPNFEACLSLARIYHLDLEKCRKILMEFRGIEHRLEEVPSQDGIRYMNDSKSTTIASLKWALDRMNQKVTLIMGGLHKGGDFSQLGGKISEKVQCLVLIGKAADLIERSFKTQVPIYKALSLEDAVQQARAHSKAGDVILFSPACASFDMFQDYQNRGCQFKQIVRGFKGVQTSPSISHLQSEH